jgi:multicomponent Na+:H+ antiporter subunit G
MFSVISSIALAMLALGAVLTFVRLTRGPSLPDRVISLDLIGILIVCVLVLVAGDSGQQAFLDVAMVIAWISGALVMTGATLALLAGVGVVRMPDVFTRMQASTKASTLGLGCLLAALAIRHPDVSVVMRALSIGAFVMLTTAVSAHVIARAAALTGAPLWKGTLIDERRDENPSGEDSTI